MMTRDCLLAIGALIFAPLAGCSSDLGGTIAYDLIRDAGPKDAGRDAGRDAGPLPDNCWVTGGGQIDGETLGGNAKPFRDGSVDGHWNHVTHEGQHLNARPTDIILCDDVGGGGAAPPRVDFNYIEFVGTGTWTDEGVTIDVDFRVIIEDHGEPEDDEYTLVVCPTSGGTITCDVGSGDAIHTISGELDRGNLQIHPSNPGHP